LEDCKIEDEQQRIPFDRRLAAAALLLALMGAACLVFTEQTADSTFYTELNGAASALVAGSMERTVDSFMIVSALKGGLALLEGSTVGVGFALQVGDIVQPLYDYVDFVWNVLLYAGVVLGVYRLLLETGVLLLGLKVLGAGLFISALGLAVREWRPFLLTAGRRVVIYGAAFAYVIPASLMTSAYLSNHYLEPVRAASDHRLVEMQRKVDVAHARFAALKDDISITQPQKSLDEVRQGASDIFQDVNGLVEAGARAFVLLTAAALLEVIIFPLLSALVLYTLVHVSGQRLSSLRLRPVTAGPLRL
jgi:hypothetical protein